MSEQKQDFPETIQFGGEVWKRTGLDEGEGGMLVDYEVEGKGARIHRYEDGRWLGSRKMSFGDAVPRVFNTYPMKIFVNQEKAMRFALGLTSDSAIAEIIEWLTTNGHLEGSTAVQAGIELGRKQVFSEIENLKTAA